MQVGTVFGLVALLLVQIGFILATCYLYFRFRTQADMGNAERTTWAAQLQLAVTTADSAKRQVEDIEVEHYRKLRAAHEENLRALAACQMDVQILKGKMASEERMDRKRRSKEDAPAATEKEEEEGEPAALPPAVLEQLKKMGLAVPLAPQPAENHSQPRRRFGQPPIPIAGGD